MPIAERELNRDFIVVDERTTVQQVRDQVAATGSYWTYIVVQLASGQYAVLQLNELIQALQGWLGGALLQRTLDATLSEVPGLLVPRAADGVERDEVEAWAAKRLVRQAPGHRLVVLAEGRVAGLLVMPTRAGLMDVDLDWLGGPAPTPKEVLPTPEGAGTLATRETPQPSQAPEPEPQKRWINAEIEDHDQSTPLQMDQVYTLAFDVDVEVRATSLVTDAELRYQFEAGEEMVALTIQLESDDFEIYSGPQKLWVPRTGRSKGKARFDIEPKHEGQGLINAVFLKDGNFIQLITLKLYTGELFSSATLGRPVDAAFAVQPRDLNLTILEAVAGFQVIMSGAVGAMATLPITAQELDQWVTEVRQVLRDDIVYMRGPDRAYVYQAGIDIPPTVNQRALQRLAEAGYLLYRRIFYGRAADAQARLLGDRLRQMAQGERLRIQVFSQRFMLPWGVLYVAERYDPGSVDPEKFLGLRHIIEHIPLQPDMRVTGRTIDSRPALAVSLNVNTDIEQQVGAPLVTNQRRYWDGVSQRGGARVIVRQTGDEVTQALADASTSDQILYFYCHADSRSLAEGDGPGASALILSGSGRLTLKDLDLFAPTDSVLPGAPLVFINACESAELSPLFYDGFVPYFMAKGARGVIGTECETPALFAAEWAGRFFDRFLAGESLGQAFLELRREFFYEHNNLLGLLYALYVDGDTQIVPGLQVA